MSWILQCAAWCKEVKFLNDELIWTEKPSRSTYLQASSALLDAQKQVGLALEAMEDEDKVADLDENQLASLNEAYEAFNGTSSQRDAVVKNAKTECEITLR